MRQERIIRGFEEAVREDGYIQGWGISSNELMELNNSRGGVVLRAAEDKVIPSIWSAFMSVANTGVNVVANKISSMFNGAFNNASTHGNNNSNNSNNNKFGDINYNEPFSPFEVNTGLKVIMGENEILTVYNVNETIGKGLTLLNAQVFRNGDNIKIRLYNIFPKETVVRKGDIIGIAYFSTILNSEVNGGIEFNSDSVSEFRNNALNMQYTNDIKENPIQHIEAGKEINRKGIDRKGIDLTKH